MQRIFTLVIPSVVLLASPAAAEMFGEDYPPCGDQSNNCAAGPLFSMTYMEPL